jgi:O-succinylbenzoic acid--CoA ligase
MLLFSPLSDELPQGSTDFEREALEFCRQWKSGQEQFLFHTSGSTGNPKPIYVQRDAMLASAKATGEWLNLVPNDLALACLPVHYIAGAMVLVRAMVLDLRICLVEPSVNPLRNLSPIAIQLASFVPNQWHDILDSSIDLNSFFSHSKGILLGGAALSESLAERTKVLAYPIFETYGMTETVSHVAYKKPFDINFQVLNGVEFGVDERSCLRLKGAVTNDEWIQTNDIVQLQNDAYFEYLGRFDRVINSAGRKIHPEKLEQFISKHLPVGVDFFIDSLPDVHLGQRACLFYRGEFLEIEQKTLLQALRENFESWELPKQLIQLPSFQFTTTGKIDRLKSVALYLKSK